MSELEDLSGRRVRGADDQLGQQLRNVIKQRDAEGLRRLVIEQYPDVLWGEYFRELPEEDRNSAMQNLG